MKTIIVLGGTGLVGQALVGFLQTLPQLNVFGTSRLNPERKPPPDSKLLAYNTESGAGGLEKLLGAAGGCDYFINTIAVLKPDIDESNSDSVHRALQINAVFPCELAAFAARIGAKVIHVSTDGVFSGTQKAPYTERHAADAADTYGKTKALGEVISESVLNLRTSFVGPDRFQHKGLFEWFRKQEENAVITGYTDHLWSGVTTRQFAELCSRIISENEFDRLRSISGTLHYCPNKPLSKYELLETFRKVLKCKVTIKPAASPSGQANRVLETEFEAMQTFCGPQHTIEIALSSMIESL